MSPTTFRAVMLGLSAIAAVCALLFAFAAGGDRERINGSSTWLFTTAGGLMVFAIAAAIYA